MPRKLLIETDQYPYHITSRSNNREFFYLERDVLWPIFIEKLKKITTVYGCRVHAFVLMSNHYHLLISTPNSNLSFAMTYLHREVAREANRRVGRINHFFGGRYKWCSITEEDYYWNTVKYIFRNPVAVGLCEKVEQYIYSSLNEPYSLWRMVDFFEDGELAVDLNLAWLNYRFSDNHVAAIKKGLRRREFALPVDKNKKRQILDPMRRKKGLGT